MRFQSKGKNLIFDMLNQEELFITNASLLLDYLNSVEIEYTFHKGNKWIKCYENGRYLSAFQIDDIPF